MRRKGYIQDFDRVVARLKKSEVNFRVEMSGVTRIIYYLDGYGNVARKAIYHGHKGMERMEGLELVTMVRRELRKRIEEGNNAPRFKVGTKVVRFHIENMTSAMNDGAEIAEVDLNACYWTTAYHLGFLSEELYAKGWQKRKSAKIGLLAAIGSLNKKTYTEDFEFGSSKGVVRDSKDDMFRPYYWAVINRVEEVMYKAINAVPKHHFMMWLTDCIYIRKESTPIIIDLFKELGYEYTTGISHISKIERNKVFWVNHDTGEEKFVFFSKNIRHD